MRIGKDKILHFACSFAIELVLAVVLPSWLPWMRAALNVILIGGGKELYDKQHPDKHTADWLDLAADFIGAILGEVLVCMTL